MSDPLSSPTRKRIRMDEQDSPDKLNKRREKARERQRMKRERDRMIANHMSMAIPYADVEGGGLVEGAMPEPQNPVTHPVPIPPEELSKKERVRLAARERQRKHRAVVKARRMAELGIQMIPPNPHVPLGYRLNENGQMEPVHDANAIAQDGAGYGQTPGQTFARLLMTSAFINPNLKQHICRTLQMTAEELAGFEPIIATAWDHWNHQRMHYHQQAAAQRGPNDGHFPSGSSEEVANGGDMQANDYGQRFQHLSEGAMVEGVPLPTGNPIDPSLAVRETSALRNQSGEGHEEARQEADNPSG